jgi:hypothetical protein
LLGWLFGERDDRSSVCYGSNTLTLKAFISSDDDQDRSDVQSLNGIINYGTVKTSASESLLIDSSGMTAFMYQEDHTDDDLGPDLVTQSGSIMAEVRLYEGCSSVLNCNSAPIFAASATKVTLRNIAADIRSGTFSVDDDEELFGMKFASDAYARWFFPNLKAGTYAVGIFLSMKAQVEISADATLEVQVMFGDHILDVKRVKSVGGCALVEV